jgi:hypothetical protein
LSDDLTTKSGFHDEIINQIAKASTKEFDELIIKMVEEGYNYLVAKSEYNAMDNAYIGTIKYKGFKTQDEVRCFEGNSNYEIYDLTKAREYLKK